MAIFANMRTVARFEMRTLFRSWFFRIFSVLTLLILLGMNIGTLTEGGQSNWIIRAIASNIPYMNMAFLNIAQALLAVFLASDFLKRDKKLDTTEVIYTRSMTNWEYVWGKTIGVLIVFATLNILVLLMALIINMVVSGVQVDYAAYLLYPVLIGVPTLIFTLGLAFFLMSILKNQAVTLVVLLGLAAVSLFFVKDRVNHLFDYMAFTMPLMWSEIIGSGNLSEVLLHRGIYLFLGLGFILSSILLLKRLPQSRTFSLIAFVLMLGFLGLGLGSGFTYWTSFSKDQEYRLELQKISDRVHGQAHMVVDSYNLQVDHQSNMITVKAELISGQDLSSLPATLYFSLNPGLLLTAIKLNGSEITFEREKQLISIKKPSNLVVPLTLEFQYEGTIDERICYLDLTDEQMNVKREPGFIASAKRHGIVQDDYVLLTPESVWYPIPGGTFGTTLATKPIKEFSSYALQVQTKKGLVPISQGQVKQEDELWSFSSLDPYPGISLAIGEYETKILDLDSLQVELHYYKGHDSFMETLSLLADTLPVLAKESLQDYQRSLGLSYPYDFMKFVEAPVQFYAYQRVWTKAYDFVQPGLIFYPENLSYLSRSDVRKELDQAIDRALERDNMSSDADLQAQVFTNLIRNNFIKAGVDFRMMMRGGNMSFSSSSETPYSIFPNYFTFINNFVSDNYQMINASLESYIGSQTSEMGGFGGMGGVSDDEKANLALAENSFKDLLALPDDKGVLPLVISSKGKQLFNYLEAAIGSEEFLAFIGQELRDYRFKNLYFTEFIQNVENSYQVDLKNFMDVWYTGNQLPAFLVTGVKSFEIQEGDNTIYQVYYTISNTGNVDGLLNVSFRSGGRGGRGGFGGPGMGGMRGGGFQNNYVLAGRDDATNRLHIVPAQTAFTFAMTLSDPPRMMTANTLISSNLPASLTFPFPDVEKRRMTATDAIQPTSLITTLAQPNELVVDNEDPGFSVHEEGTSNKLSGLLGIDQKDSDFKYQGMITWRPPMVWTLTTQSGFYGDYIRSAYYTRSGEGERFVEWEIQIPEAGYYDVHCYLNQMVARMSSSRGRGGDRGGPGGGGNSDIKDVYHYTITHDEGEEEVSKALSNIEDGWNMLGSFYFSKGSAKVKLSNENSGRLVVADAVKWVKQ